MNKKVLVVVLVVIAAVILGLSLFSKEEVNIDDLNLDARPEGLKIEVSKKGLSQKVVADLKQVQQAKLKSEAAKIKEKVEVEKSVESIDDISSYSERLKQAYQKDADTFLKEVEELEFTFKVVNAWKKKQGVALLPFEKLNPKTVFTISLVTDSEMGEVNNKSLTEFEFSTKDVSVIRYFSTSKDFTLLNDQGRLTKEEVTLERLKTIYANNEDIITTPKGEIIGVPAPMDPNEVLPETNTEN